MPVDVAVTVLVGVGVMVPVRVAVKVGVTVRVGLSIGVIVRVAVGYSTAHAALHENVVDVEDENVGL